MATVILMIVPMAAPSHSAGDGHHGHGHQEHGHDHGHDHGNGDVQKGGLIVVIALLGIFLFSDQPILTAGALDVIGEGVVASTLGVFSFSRFALAAASPLIAGLLFDSSGIEATFLYIAGLYVVATVILMIVPMAVPRHSAGDGHHGHGHEGHGHDHGNGDGHGAH